MRLLPGLRLVGSLELPADARVRASCCCCRWCGLYSKGLQSLTFLAALAHFLLYSTLISLAEVAEMLGVRPVCSSSRPLGEG